MRRVSVQLWRGAALPGPQGAAAPPELTLAASGRAWSLKHVKESCRKCREHAHLTTHVSREAGNMPPVRQPLYNIKHPQKDSEKPFQEHPYLPHQWEQSSSGVTAPRNCTEWTKVPKVIMGITYFNRHYLPTWFVDHFVDRTISSSSNFSKVFQVLCSEIPVLLRGDLQFSWRFNAVCSQSLSVKILGSNFSTF